jgi:Trk K+ transport system NAD-binding subunit
VDGVDSDERPPATPSARGERPRFVVVGDDSLTLRTVTDLVSIFKVDVTLITADLTSRYIPSLASVPGVELVDASMKEFSYGSRGVAAALVRAGLGTASGLAILGRLDHANIDTALAAVALNPSVHVVVRLADLTLGRGVQTLVPGAVVLSDVEISAPLVAAAARGLPGQSGTRIGDRVLEMATRTAVRADEVQCGLAVLNGPREPAVLPDEASTADLVLVHRHAPGRTNGHHHRSTSAMVMRIMLRRLWIVLGVLGGVAGAGTLALALVKHLTWWPAFYLAVLSMRAGANPDLGTSVPEQIVQTVLTVFSVAIVPVATVVVAEAVVSARLAIATGPPPTLLRGHIVVAGIGRLGTRVVRLLYAAGVDLVVIDGSDHSPGVRVARELRIPVVIGDVRDEQTLREAGVRRCRTLVILGGDDDTNLAAGLRARDVRPDLRIVLRLFDTETAYRLNQALGITVSRSSSYLAAPSFVAALLGHTVLSTVAVGRRVLLVAELPVPPDTNLAGRSIATIDQPDKLRVLAVATGDTIVWSPAPTYCLRAGDRLIAVATRTGLAGVIAQTTRHV